MKRYFLLLLLVVGLFLQSCTRNEDINTKRESSLFELKSTLPVDSFKTICESLNKQIGTRTTFEDSLNYEELLRPLIADGKNIQRQILSQENVGLSEVDKRHLSNLSKEELASLSFLILASNLENRELPETRSINGQRMRSCLAVATGVAAMKDLSVNGIISATSLSRALWAIGKRYLGYVGVALPVADFWDCYEG